MASTLMTFKNGQIKLGDVTYKTISAQSSINVVNADATASDDDIEVRIPVRAGGNVTGSVLTSDITALMALVGSVVSAYIMKSATTLLGPFDAVVGVQWGGEQGGMIRADLTLDPQTIPAQYSTLAAM